MTDIEKAKKMLKENPDYTIISVKNGETVFCSYEKGIRPMIKLIRNGKNLKGTSTADRITGRAAAFLSVKTGIKELYSEVISKKAFEILKNYNIDFSYGIVSENILNNDKTDICPMEKATLDISDPDKAYEALENTINILMNKKDV
ncbi:MAG TPA: DUF1893 domain-containing protein [Tepiditoga sp.]|nr:DUF1893 domain-containing protein [Thermotogota bacterium]HOO73903.1 DUF1893 domain-containing protein [Tepiditoga sp.]